MNASLTRCALALALALPAAMAQARDDTLVSFSGGIGADPVAGIDGAGMPIPNVVRGVPAGGRAWVIDELKVRIRNDGTITGRGTGLLFSGGEAIGTRGGVGQVFATLFCDGLDYNSEPVALDLAGDFSLRGMLSAVPPSPCNGPVLLIRNAAGNQAWFAAGIPRLGRDD